MFRESLINHSGSIHQRKIGGLIATQLAPPADPMITKCFLDLETASYQQIKKGRVDSSIKERREGHHCFSNRVVITGLADSPSIS